MSAFPSTVSISRLQNASDLEGKSIKARVNFRWRITENPLNPEEKMLKLQLADLTRPEATPSSASFFLFGDWAEHCTFLAPNDTIHIAGAKLEASEDEDFDELPFRIVARCPGKTQLKVFREGSRRAELIDDNCLGKGMDEAERVLPKPAKRMKKISGKKNAPKYEYVTLASLAETTEGRHNVHAIVTDYTHPKKTRGTDYFMAIRLIDESRPDPSKAFSAVLFRKLPENFPQLSKCGDIIRMHRAVVDVYQGEPQIKTGVGFASIVISGTRGASMEPLDLAGRKSYSTIDEARITALRKFSAKVITEKSLMPVGYRFSAATFPIDSQFDVIGKVVSRLSGASGTSFEKLRIWDGSGLNATCCQWDPAYKSMDGFIDVCQEKSEMQNNAVRAQDRLHLLREDEWVKLRNIQAERVGTTIRVSYAPSRGSSFCRFPAVSNDVRNVLRDHQNRQLLASRHVPPAGMKIVTVTPFESVPPTTLSEIINHDVVPFKFRCVARAVRHVPEALEDIVIRQGDKWLYMLRLDLEDATGQLPSLLYGQDADEFFHGIPAGDLRSNNVSLDALKTRFSTVFAKDVWINCCIKKYTSSTGRTNYRIFGTSIMP